MRVNPSSASPTRADTKERPVQNTRIGIRVVSPVGRFAGSFRPGSFRPCFRGGSIRPY